MQTLTEYLKPNPYPGRGVFLGQSPDKRWGIAAYFIMGRSENSRNRIFIQDEADPFTIRTQAHDPAKVEDPSLIIYAPVRVFGPHTIVTNGDQTDTIIECLERRSSFEAALGNRTYEPDAPNFTPRISGQLICQDSSCRYQLSILKKGCDEDCQRFFFHYQAQPGCGHLIHTYAGDGNPLPSFQGEPVCLPTCNEPACLSQELWTALNEDNRVSLFVRYIDLYNPQHTEFIIENKHSGGSTGQTGPVAGSST